HFTDTPREVYSHLIQCRTGHGLLEEYYVSFVALADRAKNHVKMREHILCDCSLFTHQRIHLRKVSYNIILVE
ncbi:hypothetical protein F4604DRAFT_1541197, partial [Suillus subluteus]